MLECRCSGREKPSCILRLEDEGVGTMIDHCAPHQLWYTICILPTVDRTLVHLRRPFERQARKTTKFVSSRTEVNMRPSSGLDRPGYIRESRVRRGGSDGRTCRSPAIDPALRPPILPARPDYPQ